LHTTPDSPASPQADDADAGTPEVGDKQDSAAEPTPAAAGATSAPDDAKKAGTPAEAGESPGRDAEPDAAATADAGADVGSEADADSDSDEGKSGKRGRRRRGGRGRGRTRRDDDGDDTGPDEDDDDGGDDDDADEPAARDRRGGRGRSRRDDADADEPGTDDDDDDSSDGDDDDDDESEPRRRTRGRRGGRGRRNRNRRSETAGDAGSDGDTGDDDDDGDDDEAEKPRRGRSRSRGERRRRSHDDEAEDDGDDDDADDDYDDEDAPPRRRNRGRSARRRDDGNRSGDEYDDTDDDDDDDDDGDEDDNGDDRPRSRRSRRGGRNRRGRDRDRDRDRDRGRDRDRDRDRRPRRPAARQRMLINATEPEELRIAILEGNELVDYNIERPHAEVIGALGNIYKGVVQNVEPAIQAAFIDIGLSKNGFLHVSDVNPAYGERLKTRGDDGSLGNYESLIRQESRRNGSEAPKIQDLLKKGQEVLVQVTKSQIRHKGPSLSTYISIPGRFLVLMPNVAKRGVSRKIQDDRARRKLKDLIAKLDGPEDMGFIARTAAAGQTLDDLDTDLGYLHKLWNVILRQIRDSRSPACVYEESDLIIRTVRDVFRPQIEEIVIDDADTHEKVADFMRAIEPRYADRVKHYDDPTPLFYRFGVEREIEKLNDAKVPLKSGGFLVIEQTEALVAIDVNSGRFKNESDSEKMAVKINLEAAAEITRQLRLRDLGGLIINDFIDMRDPDNQRAVEHRMRDGLREDKAKTKVCRMSPLGLIEMTRQRVKQSHARTTQDTCPHCNGTGYVKSLPSQTLTVMRKIKMAMAQDKARKVTVTGPLPVVQHINNSMRLEIAELERDYEREVEINAATSAAIHDILVTYTTDQGHTYTV
jgi:ribonuclease E